MYCALSTTCISCLFCLTSNQIWCQLWPPQLCGITFEKWVLELNMGPNSYFHVNHPLIILTFLLLWSKWTFISNVYCVYYMISTVIFSVCSMDLCSIKWFFDYCKDFISLSGCSRVILYGIINKANPIFSNIYSNAYRKKPFNKGVEKPSTFV